MTWAIFIDYQFTLSIIKVLMGNLEYPVSSGNNFELILVLLKEPVFVNLGRASLRVSAAGLFKYV